MSENQWSTVGEKKKKRKPRAKKCEKEDLERQKRENIANQVLAYLEACSKDGQSPEQIRDALKCHIQLVWNALDIDLKDKVEKGTKNKWTVIKN